MTIPDLLIEDSGDPDETLTTDWLSMTVICGPIDHDYQQAQSPYEAMLYCRKCGETRTLNQRREEAA